MLIVVEGCVGAGKTTIAKLVSQLRGSATLLEDFSANPFLIPFYENPKNYATETEFTFLLQHYHQLKKEADDINCSEVVSDFHLYKDLIYADLNLSPEAILRIFYDLYKELASQVHTPDLMICLSATTELVVERIRNRNREFELHIGADYYGQINSAYEKFFDKYDGLKLNISMNEWDFVKDPELVLKLSNLIDGKLNEV